MRVHCRVGRLLLAWLCATTAVQAQDPPTPPTTTPSEALTTEALEARLAAAKSNTALDEATRTKITELYQQALDSVRAAGDWNGKATEYDSARSGAPARLTAVREELALPQTDVEPDVSPEDSIQQLEQRLAQAEADLKTAREQTASLDEERKRRGTRRVELPAATTAAKQKLDETSTALAAPAPKDETPELSAARIAALKARKTALEAEIRAYEAETASYDARGELLTARRDLAARTAARAETLVRTWQELVNERRRVDAAAAAKAAAAAARKAGIKSDPVVAGLAKENAEWAEKRAKAKLADKIEKATRRYDEAVRLADEIAGQYASVTSKVRAAGLTNAMGLLLRRQRDALPDARVYRRAFGRRQAEISDIQVKIIEAEDQRSDLADLNAKVRQSLAEIGESARQADPQDLEEEIRELWKTRRDLIDALINDYDSYFRKLVDVDNAERRLITRIEEFRQYIDEHILWMRSGNPPSAADLQGATHGLAWLFSGRNWTNAAAAFSDNLRRNTTVNVLAAVVFILLMIARRRLCARIEEIGTAASRSTCCELAPTAIATCLTLVVAAIWPMAVWGLGWAVASRLDSTDFAGSLGMGLQHVGVAFAAIELLRQVLRSNGLAESHFGWTQRSARKLRRSLYPVMAIGLPALFLVSVLEASQEDEWQNSLGRAAFVLGMCIVAQMAFRLLHPRRTFLRDVSTGTRDGWLLRTQWVWIIVGVGSPIILMALALMGYYYTALRISGRLGFSVFLLIGVCIAYGLALRVILIARRRLAIEQARERRKEREAAGAQKDGDTGNPPAEQPEVLLANIDAQSRRLLRTITILAVAVGLWLVWSDVIPALGILDRVTLWSTATTVYEETTGPDGQMAMSPRPDVVAVSLADLGFTLIILLVTFIAARNLPGLVEILLLRRLPLQTGERYAVATLLRYVVTIVGLIMAFQAVGVSWSKVQWLVAAITVGLGFGLQEIFANFVSGLVLLFEQPIRIGDTVTVGDTEGTVTRIQMRATTVTDWNRKEMVIPNKEFVTGRIINWSLSDQIIRLIVRVGIAYGSDTRRARDLLLEVAEKDPLVLADPKPKAIFMEFGDSSLNFELRVFVKDIDDFLQVRHELHTAIDDAFRRAGIEIAFPQRDVHVRSIRDALTVEQEPPKTS